MARVTLKASPDGLQKAKAALRHFASKIALADLAGLSRTTVQAFFAGKEISVESFRQICEALELPWEAISGIKTEALSISPTRVEQPLENKSDSADCDS
ncbi:MAG: helix-turn-helix transcriptional regulator [Coleofasciculaceae cyanobacterium SM2_1_6]|nr:helix-turn-helix transcriptional regulator [Coleofasciculaceae cyanobacterium SM2_1_6]